MKVTFQKSAIFGHKDQKFRQYRLVETNFESS